MVITAAIIGLLSFLAVLFIGVSSNESLAANPAYRCCSFRGSVVALNAKTGEMRRRPSTCPTTAVSQVGTAASGLATPRD